MGGQLKGWMYKRSYLEIKKHYQGLEEKSDVVKAYSCNFLDITMDCGVLLLRESFYRFYFHCKYFGLMGQNNGRWL